MDKPQKESSSISRQMGDGYTLSLNLVVSTLLGLGLGLMLDNWLETKPIFLLIGLGFGFVAGLRRMVQSALRSLKETQE